MVDGEKGRLLCNVSKISEAGVRSAIGRFQKIGLRQTKGFRERGSRGLGVPYGRKRGEVDLVVEPGSAGKHTNGTLRGQE